MKRTALRRAFRDERMRTLYLTMSEAGWRGSVSGDGHVLMIAPDGGTRISLSTTAVGARSALNNEAKYKRWVRLQNAMTRATGIPPVHHHAGETPMTTTVNESEEAQMEGQVETPNESLIVEGEETPDEDGTVEAPAGVFYCADGCGKVVSKEGGYARGHNPNSMANATKARAAQAQRRNGASLFKPAPDQFTVDEVITIANYGGSGGLIEVTKLRDGLIMALRLRGER